MNDIGSDDGVLVECTLLLCCIEEAGGIKAVVVVLLLVEIEMQTSAVANFDRWTLFYILYLIDCIILQLIYELEIVGGQVGGGVVLWCTFNYYTSYVKSTMWLHFQLSGHKKRPLLDI